MKKKRVCESSGKAGDDTDLWLIPPNVLAKSQNRTQLTQEKEFIPNIAWSVMWWVCCFILPTLITNKKESRELPTSGGSFEPGRQKPTWPSICQDHHFQQHHHLLDILILQIYACFFKDLKIISTFVTNKLSRNTLACATYFFQIHGRLAECWRKTLLVDPMFLVSPLL